MFAITIWWIWRFRSNHTLGDKQWKIQNIIHFTNIMCTHLTYVNIHSFKHHINRHIVRRTPQDGCAKLNIDGSCGAFGDISFGGLLCDNKRNWIARFSSNEG